MSYYGDDGNNENTENDYRQAFVIATLNPPYRYQSIILVLDSHGVHEIVRIPRQAFNPSRFAGESKSQIRKLSEPLTVGQCISIRKHEIDRNAELLDFRRLTPLQSSYTIRVDSGYLEILVESMIHQEEDGSYVIWSSLFEGIEVEPRLAQRAVPDVPLFAWFMVKVDAAAIASLVDISEMDDGVVSVEVSGWAGPSQHREAGPDAIALLVNVIAQSQWTKDLVLGSAVTSAWQYSDSDESSSDNDENAGPSAPSSRGSGNPSSRRGGGRGQFRMYGSQHKPPVQLKSKRQKEAEKNERRAAAGSQSSTDLRVSHAFPETSGTRSGVLVSWSTIVCTDSLFWTRVPIVVPVREILEESGSRIDPGARVNFTAYWLTALQEYHVDKVWPAPATASVLGTIPIFERDQVVQLKLDLIASDSIPGTFTSPQLPHALIGDPNGVASLARALGLLENSSGGNRTVGALVTATREKRNSVLTRLAVHQLQAEDEGRVQKEVQTQDEVALNGLEALVLDAGRKRVCFFVKDYPFFEFEWKADQELPEDVTIGGYVMIRAVLDKTTVGNGRRSQQPPRFWVTACRVQQSSLDVHPLRIGAIDGKVLAGFSPRPLHDVSAPDVILHHVLGLVDDPQRVLGRLGIGRRTFSRQAGANSSAYVWVRHEPRGGDGYQAILTPWALVDVELTGKGKGGPSTGSKKVVHIDLTTELAGLSLSG